MWTTVLGSAERLDRFEDMVRAYFEGQGVDVELVRGMVRPRGGPLEGGAYGLGNLSQLCAAAEEGRWGELIAGHFGAMARSQAAAEDLESATFDRVKDRLMVRLWERSDLAGGAERMVWREDLPRLATVLCVDLPEAIRTVPREDAILWGQEDEELFERAMANVRREVRPELERIDVEGGAVWLVQAESFYVASLAVEIDRFPELIGKYGTLVSVPVRQAILAVPVEGIEALKAAEGLIRMTLGAEERGPGSISRRVWWWRDGMWHELEYEPREDGITVMPSQGIVEILKEMASGGGA